MSAKRAGTIAIRTTMASKRTAAPRPKPIIWTKSLSSRLKPGKTLTMMIAAAVTTRPWCAAAVSAP
jgi:hypothetical protein